MYSVILHTQIQLHHWKISHTPQLSQKPLILFWLEGTNTSQWKCVWGMYIVDCGKPGASTESHLQYCSSHDHALEIFLLLRRNNMAVQMAKNCRHEINASRSQTARVWHWFIQKHGRHMFSKLIRPRGQLFCGLTNWIRNDLKKDHRLKENY